MSILSQFCAEHAGTFMVKEYADKEKEARYRTKRKELLNIYLLTVQANIPVLSYETLVQPWDAFP
jgi:hypothetical protein